MNDFFSSASQEASCTLHQKNLERLGREDISPGEKARFSFFSIRGFLLAFFLGLSSIPVIIGIFVPIAFGFIRHSFHELTQKSLPAFSSTLQISEISTDILSNVPLLAESKTPEMQKGLKYALDEKTATLHDSLAKLQTLDVRGPDMPIINALIRDIEAEITKINLIVSERFALAETIEASGETLSQLHISFLRNLEPFVDNAVYTLIAGTEENLTLHAKNLMHYLEQQMNRLTYIVLLMNQSEELFFKMHKIIESKIEEEQSSLYSDLSEDIKEYQDIFKGSPLKTFDDEEILKHFQKMISLFDQMYQKGEHDLDDFDYIHKDYMDILSYKFHNLMSLSLEEIQKKENENAKNIIDINSKEINKFYNLISLESRINLAVSLINQAINASDMSSLSVLQERFQSVFNEIQRIFSELGGIEKFDTLYSARKDIRALGLGPENIFSLRRKDFAFLAETSGILTRSTFLFQTFLAEIKKLVEQVKKEGMDKISMTDTIFFYSELFIILTALLGLCGALYAFFFYVNPKLIHPIEDITKSMIALAQGNTEIDIPGRTRKDELGHMARALDVFHEVTVLSQKSNLKEIEETRRRLSDAIESISEAFSLYDKNDRLVIFNRKYASLVYPEIQEDIKSGMDFEQILRLSLARKGVFEAIGKEEEWLQKRLQGHKHPHSSEIIQKKEDVWLMLSERHTSDGGIVAVYSDITKMKEREHELDQKSRTMESLSLQLSKYLSPQIYQSIFRGEKSAIIETRRKKLTVFFSDLVGFTQLSDRLESEDLTALLNRYLTEMTEIALSYGATIDKYIGDAIMIFFGDPVSDGVQEDALRCVKMAIHMQERLNELNKLTGDAELSEILQCRIGIHTGYCTVGNFGSQDRLDYTIVGGSVNLASRLEKESEKGGILVSSDTWHLIKKEILCHKHGALTIRGFAYPVETYRVVGLKEDKNNTDQHRVVVHSNPHFSVTADLDEMSAAEKEESRLFLERLLKRL